MYLCNLYLISSVYLYGIVDENFFQMNFALPHVIQMFPEVLFYKVTFLKYLLFEALRNLPLHIFTKRLWKNELLFEALVVTYMHGLNLE